jgi:hypothetical protein
MDDRAKQIEAGLRELAEKIHGLTLGLALVDQRMQTLGQVETTMTRLDRLLVKVIGVNGDNGMVSELNERVAANEAKLGENLKGRVAANETKLEGLDRSKAAFVGWIAGASAVCGLVVGVAMKYLP